MNIFGRNTGDPEGARHRCPAGREIAVMPAIHANPRFSAELNVMISSFQICLVEGD
jgi:hypothetical protein